ncbi:hypothetical protein J6W78_09915 [bacterium]|nr:hypothetical protein [bacterium]
MKRIFVLSFIVLFLQIVCGKEVPKIAVMEIIDNSGSLDKKMLKTEEDQMRAQLINKGKKKVQVISTVEQGEAISRMQKESYRLDRDRDGQIELGKLISAREILYTVVSSFGAKFTVTTTLIDLKTGNNIDAASADFDGGANIQQSLRTALEKNIDFLVDQMEDPDKLLKAEQEREAELNFCKKARQDKTSDGWISYLRRYPEGVCAAEAEKELDKIACGTARSKNTIDAWREYLNNFPQGNCAYEAENNILSLKRVEEYKKDKEDEDAKSRERLKYLKNRNRNR